MALKSLFIRNFASKIICERKYFVSQLLLFLSPHRLITHILFAYLKFFSELCDHAGQHFLRHRPIFFMSYAICYLTRFEEKKAKSIATYINNE